MAKKKSKGKGEKYTEVFKIENKGKDKIVKKQAVLPAEKPSKKQVSQENKILKGFFITIGIIVGIFLVVTVFHNYMSNFEYKGVEFEIVDEIAPYKTSFPVFYQGNVVPYNFYIRNDPRELAENIEFDGELDLRENLVIDSTTQLVCDSGRSQIAINNVVRLQNIMGSTIVNESLKCDSEGDYTYIDIRESNETSIEQTGISCYNININNCEILEGMERFMIEMFVEMNEFLEN